MAARDREQADVQEGSAPVSRRERPAKPALSREAILRAAMDILDRDGQSAVTMRRVAEALDTGPSSLYVYVKNRTDLLTGLTDIAFGNVTFPPRDSGTWQERIKAVLLAYQDELTRHPGLASVTFGDVPASSSEYRGMVYMIEAFREGGWTDIRIAWALDQLMLLMNATSLEQASIASIVQNSSSDDAVVEHLSEIVQRMPLDYIPEIAFLPYYITLGSPRHRLGWMIDCVLTGAPQVALPTPDTQTNWFRYWRRAGLPLPDSAKEPFD